MGEYIISRSDSAENGSRSPKRKDHCGMVNSNSGETVLLSELYQLLTHVKGEMKYHEDEILKRFREERSMTFSDNAVKRFRKRGDQGGYALLSLLREENQHNVYHKYAEKIVAVKSGVLNGGFFDYVRVSKMEDRRSNRLCGAEILSNEWWQAKGTVPVRRNSFNLPLLQEQM